MWREQHFSVQKCISLGYPVAQVSSNYYKFKKSIIQFILLILVSWQSFILYWNFCWQRGKCQFWLRLLLLQESCSCGCRLYRCRVGGYLQCPRCRYLHLYQIWPGKVTVHLDTIQWVILASWHKFIFCDFNFGNLIAMLKLVCTNRYFKSWQTLWKKLPITHQFPKSEV